jgi:S-layer homology domain.
MKKLLALLLIVSMFSSMVVFAAAPFDVPVPEFTALKTDTTGANTLTGSIKGKDIITNAYFSDIKNTYGHESIVRMAALGVVKQYGDKKYYPSSKATGYDIIGMLVRMRGNEAAVMQRVYNLAGSSTTPERLRTFMDQEYLVEAQTLGIVNATEVLNLDQPATKETLAVWIARTIGLAPIFNQQTVFTYSDWANVNPIYRSLIEDMTTNGIIPLKNDGTFAPKENVTRGELAVIMAAALETQYAARTITSGFGLVIGVKPETIYNNGDTVKRNTITVKNTDGTVTNLVSETHSKGNQQFDYVTHKNGIVSNNGNLKLGDEIEYVTLAGALQYVQVIDNNLILEKIAANSEADLYTTFHYGTLVDINTKTQYKNGTTVVTEIYRVVDITGDVFDILVDEDLYTGLREDVITYKENEVGGVHLLEIGDVMEYLVNEDREIIYIKVAPLEKTTLSGTVREISPIAVDGPATMTIYGYDDKVYQLPLAPYANLRINDRVTDINNFVYGMPVDVEIANGYITLVEGESFSGEPGYIPKYGKMRMGDIVTVYQNTFSVKLNDGTIEFYDIDQTTQFTKDGNLVSKDSLKSGMAVKVYFDNISALEASKVELEAPEILFEIIYKGKIKNVNGARKEIQIIGSDGVSKPEYISNNDWLPAESYVIDLKTDDKTEYYAGNQKLSMTELERSYSGYQLYAVVKKVFGQPTVVRLSVKTGGEMMYSSTVRSVDHTLGSFDISTKENFNITDGTIVIKDGLVVPSSQLKSRDTVFVVSESPMGAYDKNAMVVKVITPYDNIFDKIRIGAVETVNPSNITFRNYTQYTNNFLNAVNPNETGYYKFYTDSKIVDLTDPANIKTIKPADFWHDSYARSENYDPNFNMNMAGLQFKRYYAFMIVNESDSSIIAMHLRQKGLLQGQNFDDNLYKETDIASKLEDTFTGAVLSRGIVTSDDTTWDRLEITDSHDWTDYTGQWTANKANIFVKYTDAIVMKNNKIISIEDIQMGDYIYVMRIKENALVIFVQ